MSGGKRFHQSTTYVDPKRRHNKRINPSTRTFKHELTYEQVHEIAEKYIVKKMGVREIAKSMFIRPKLVLDITLAKTHHDYWINAIADLGRKGLIDG